MRTAAAITALCLTIALAFPMARAQGQVIVVNDAPDIADFAGGRTVADLPGPDGRVTFREAVIAANNTPGAQSIHFNIPQARWWSLFPECATVLANYDAFIITDDSTTIDGRSQTAFTGDTNPDGNEVCFWGEHPNSMGIPLIIVHSDDNVFVGLDQMHRRGYGISLAEDAERNRIIGNTISAPLYAAVRIQGSSNTVGGTAPGEGNVLSSGNDGVRVESAFQAPPPTGNRIIGNTLSGSFSGVHIRAGAVGTIVGGPTPAERNVISGAGHYGEEGFPVGDQVNILDASDTVVEGNYIGTDATGNVAVSQRGPTGVQVRSSAGTTIRGNVIGGIRIQGTNHYLGQWFGWAIELDGNSSNTTIADNHIGIGADGQSAIPNLNGVRAGSWPGSGTPTGTTIGGTVAEVGNVIAHNERDGVGVESGAQGVAVLGNVIRDNGQEGIDLGINGPTANDPSDPDEGANRLQNSPEVESAELLGDFLTVSFLVDSAPANATYPLRVEFFRADDAGEEGALFLGAAVYPAPGSADATFDVTGMGIVEGDRVLGTATDAAGNTSEFGASVEVVPSVSTAGEPGPGMTNGYSLSAVQPNPFRGSAAVTLELAVAQIVRVEMFDVLGRRAATLHDRVLSSGVHELVLDAAHLPAGAYVVRFTGPTFTASRRVVLLR